MKAPKIKKYADGGTPKYATKKMTAKQWEEENLKAGRMPYPGSAAGREGHGQYFDPSKYKVEKDPSTGLYGSTKLDPNAQDTIELYTYDYSAPKTAASVSGYIPTYVDPEHKPVVIGTAGTYNPNNETTYIDPSMQTGTKKPIIEEYSTGGKLPKKAPSLKKKVAKYANGGELTPDEQNQGFYMQNGIKYNKSGIPTLNTDTSTNTGEATSLNTQPLTTGTEFKTSGSGDTASTAIANPEMSKMAGSTDAGGTGTTGAPVGKGEKKKGGGGSGDKVAASMGWMQYANMAKDIGKGLIKRDTITDPNTGEQISYAKDRNNAGIDKAITPYHEKWQQDYKEGDSGSMASTLLGAATGLGPVVEIAYEGLYGEKKDKDKFEKKKATFEAQAKTAQGMSDRNARASLATGGTIKGPGTGKSDSILSKIGKDGIPAGSFITPAENNDMAKAIRAKILGDNPEKKAKFKNGGETEDKDLAVSNGEHLFTPKEKAKITNLLGEEILEELAPEAEENDEKKCGGKVKMADGGTIPEGTKLGKYYYKKGSWVDADGNKLTKEFGQKYTDAYYKQTGGLSAEERAYRADIEAANRKNNPSYNMPVKSAEALVALQGSKPVVLGGKKSAPKSKESIKIQDMGTVEPIQVSAEELITPKGTEEVKAEIKMPEETTPQMDKKQNGSVLRGLGSALEYGVPALQTAMGAKYLKDSGKRPVDAMDKDFVESVEKAKQNALFGFTPEEKFALDQQNQNMTNAASFAARNLSGGSSAVAQANTRAALNQSYMRGLESLIKGKQLQMDKQQYADAMIQAKQNKSRQLFQDTMTGWAQNQQSGAALLGAGLQNAIGAKRYNDELEAQKRINQAGNAWTNTI